ncbi:MAG: hypothetical protein EOO65_02570 [Methanosarcinales archaeon]|nr:MAG: hypothetical protein EOO65_02570 [Methanosarcinales archaeon]
MRICFDSNSRSVAEKRQAEARRIREKFPGRVPVIVERSGM